MFLVTFTLSPSTLNYDTDNRKSDIAFGRRRRSLRLFKWDLQLEPRSPASLACTTETSVTTYTSMAAM